MRVGKEVELETEEGTWFLYKAKQWTESLHNGFIRKTGEENVIKRGTGSLEKVERVNRQNKHDSDRTCQGTHRIKNE